MLALTIGRIGEPHRRRDLTYTRSLVAHVRPQPIGFGSSVSRGASTGIGVSCSVHDIGNENIRTQNINQRNQQRADVSDPLRKERTIELNVFTRVDFRLPIEREMISVFTDEHVGQEPGTGHAAFDRARRRRYGACRSRDLGRTTLRSGRSVLTSGMSFERNHFQRRD